MEKIIYIGPELSFKFAQSRPEPKRNLFDAVVKSGSIKLSVIVEFEVTQVKYKEKVGPIVCTMGISIGSVIGSTANLDQMNKALHIITINSKLASEVCSEAYLNGFLDEGF